MTTVSLFLGEIICIQGAFPPNVEPACSDGLQQPLENYGQDGHGGKITTFIAATKTYWRA